MIDQAPVLPFDPAVEFPIMRRLAFFNHAGVAPLSARAATAMTRYAAHAAESAYVDSGWYVRAREVKQAAARLLHAAGPEEIAFIPNTSTGLNLVAGGLEWREGDEVVISNVEYPANRYPWENLARLGVRLIEVRQQPDGRIDVEDVVESITSRTRVVSLSHVQYASGHRLDLTPVSEMVHRAGGYLCVDAIQSLGAIPLDVRAMGVDFLAADGHKWMLGPEGCGVFYCRGSLIESLRPHVVGWMNMVNASDYSHYQFEFEKDARRFEPGTYNIPGIHGMGASLDLLLEVGVEQVWARIEWLTKRLSEGLEARGYRVFSPRKRAEERSGIVVFEPPAGAERGTPAMREIVSALERQGVVIVMRGGRLRASPHFYNSGEQIDALLNALP